MEFLGATGWSKSCLRISSFSLANSLWFWGFHDLLILSEEPKALRNNSHKVKFQTQTVWVQSAQCGSHFPAFPKSISQPPLPLCVDCLRYLIQAPEDS